MKKHTLRIVGILKEVIADMEGEILAYTAKTTIPNITKHDVEMMIMELECECTHPNGMLTKCFAPETCCPDQLITFSNGGKNVAVNCQPMCVHHCKHQKMPMTEAEEIDETIKRR